MIAHLRTELDLPAIDPLLINGLQFVLNRLFDEPTQVDFILEHSDLGLLLVLAAKLGGGS